MLITHLPFNISPKLAYTVLTSIVAWVLAHYAISIDPGVSLVIASAIASAVGYKAPTGELLPGEVGEGSDSRMSPSVKSKLG